MGFGLSVVLFDFWAFFRSARQEVLRFEVICNLGQYQIHGHALLICQAVEEIASS